jgi:argininosuccinate lyase
MKSVFETLSVNKKQMEYLANKNFVGATTLLEQLVLKYKMPFRKAKIVVETAIKYSKDQDKIILDAILKACKENKLNAKLTQQEIDNWQNPENIFKIIISSGGPGLVSLKKSLIILNKKVIKLNAWVKEKKNNINKAQMLLENIELNIMKGEK